jgi:creatinine amidohydrolase/Fe(II)-dependent formamide hydrolase-like protein
MLIEKSNWMMVEEYLKKDDRIVFVLGATEEHGYNTLATDTQCAYEVAKEAGTAAALWTICFFTCIPRYCFTAQ